jgi:phage-related protein (TIGR01555 family)
VAAANDAVTRLQAQVAAHRANDGVFNAMSGLGGAGDKSSFSTWAPPTVLSQSEVESMFRSDWLSRQIVTAPAADATREWVMHKAPSSEDFATKMCKAEARFGVRARVYEAEWNARLYGGSILFMGVAKGDDVMELREPFDYHTTSKGQLRYLRVLDRWRAQGNGTLDSQIASPNFDFPEFYGLNAHAFGSVLVHHTRVIRFDGDVLPWHLWTASNRWNDSVLQSSNDAIKAVNTAMQAIVSMIHEANFDIVHSPDMAMLAASGQGEALRARWSMASMMKSWMRVLLLDSQETYETRQRTFTELAAIIEKLQITVSGAADIPFTRLYGQSPAGLTATGENDLQNYYNAIASGQETKLRPKLEVLFEVLARSEIGDLPDDYTFIFNPLLKEASSVKATTEATEASTANTYVTMGAIKPSTVAKRLKQLGVYEITDEDIDELVTAEEDAPEPQYPEGAPTEGGEGEEGPEGVDPTDEGDTSAEGAKKVGDSLLASPKDALILSEADDALDAFDVWARSFDRVSVHDDWRDQERDELGRWGFGSGAASQARKEHVSARNEFAASTKKKDSLRGKVSRARAALAKAVESGHSAKIQAAAQRLHEHATAHAEHAAKHDEAKQRVKASTKALKEVQKAPKAAKAAKAPEAKAAAPVALPPETPPPVDTPRPTPATVMPARHSVSGDVTHQHVLEVHTYLKPGILDHIEAAGTRTVFTDKIVRRDGSDASGVTGIFTPGEHGAPDQIQVLAINRSSVKVALPPRQGMTGTISGTQIGQHQQAITMTHEGAHAAMKNMVRSTRRTNDPTELKILRQFNSAYEASIAAGKNKSFSRYSHKSPGEFVAEAVAAYHHEPAYLKSVDPAAYKAARDFVAHTGYGKVHPHDR